MEEMVQPNIAMAEAGVRLNVSTTSYECVGMSQSLSLFMRAWMHVEQGLLNQLNLDFLLLCFLSSQMSSRHAFRAILGQEAVSQLLIF